MNSVIVRPFSVAFAKLVRAAQSPVAGQSAAPLSVHALAIMRPLITSAIAAATSVTAPTIACVRNCR